MTTKHCSFLAATLILLSLTVACAAPAAAQSTTRNAPNGTLKEDFYQPVQELWNRPTTETPDIASGFEPGPAPARPTGPALAGQNGPSFPDYTQQGMYDEIPVPSTTSEPGYPSGPTYAETPVEGTLPSIVGSEAPGAPTSSAPFVAETIPPGSAIAVPTVPITTAPINDAIDAFPTTGAIFFRWDALSGLVSHDDGVTIGSEDDAGVYVSNGILFPFTNSLRTDVFDYTTSWGDRFEFGGLREHGGWIAGILDWDQSLGVNASGGGIQFSDPIGMLLGYADGNEDAIDDDLDGDNVYGRNGVDLGTPDPNNPGMFLPIYDGVIDATAPDDTDDLVTWVPVFGNLQATTHIDLNGFELMKAWRRHQAGSRFGFTHHWLTGVRYMHVNEQFSLNASGSFFDPTSVDSSVKNFIIGPQIGNEFCRRVGDLRVGGSLRFLFGINSQRGEQSGSYAVNGMPGGQNQPLNLSPGAFSTVDQGTTFSPVFEWRVDLAYDIGRHVAARVGYTGFVVGGIGRAVNSVEYALPSFGMSLNDDDSLVFNAFTVGLEFYFY